MVLNKEYFACTCDKTMLPCATKSKWTNEGGYYKRDYNGYGFKPRSKISFIAHPLPLIKKRIISLYYERQLGIDYVKKVLPYLKENPLLLKSNVNLKQR